MKGVDSIVADLQSKLEYDPSKNTKDLFYNQCFGKDARAQFSTSYNPGIFPQKMTTWK